MFAEMRYTIDLRVNVFFFMVSRQGKILQTATGVGIRMDTEVKCRLNQFRGADTMITPK